MNILVVLLLCARALSLPANQPVETPQDLLQRVLAANPLENDIGMGLDEINNAKENDNRPVNNPAQVVQMLQKVLQKEESPAIPATTEQDLTTYEPVFEVQSQQQTDKFLDFSDNKAPIEDLTENRKVPNNEGDKYTVTADVGIITFDPSIEVTEEKPKSGATEQVYPTVQDEEQYSIFAKVSPQPINEGNVESSPDVTEDQTESTNQIQENSAVPMQITVIDENTPVVDNTPTEENLILTTGSPEKEESVSKYNPIIFPDDAQPQEQETVLPNEGNSEPKDNFSQQPDDFKVTLPDITNTENNKVAPPDTVTLDSAVEETTNYNVQIPNEENPVISPFDTLPLDPVLESTPEENPDSYVETPLQYNPQLPQIDDIPIEEKSDSQIPVDDITLDTVLNEQIMENTPVQENPELLEEAPIDDGSLIIPLNASPPESKNTFEPEPTEQDTNIYAEDPLEGDLSVRPLDLATPEEPVEGIMTEEAPLLTPLDTLPLEPFNEETLPEENSEVPFDGSPDQDPIPQDMSIVPLENIPESVVEPLPMEPEDPQYVKEHLTPPLLDENPLVSPVMEPAFDIMNSDSEANPPESVHIPGNQDMLPDADVNTNYPIPSMNETPDSGPFELNPNRPIDDYPGNLPFDDNLSRPIDVYPGSLPFDDNQENMPYKPIQGMDENFASGQFYPSSNVGAGDHFQFPKHPPGLDEISDSFEYDPYEQVPFVSSQSGPYYNSHWGFPDIYEVPKFGKRPMFNPGDRYIGNKYYDRGEFDYFPGNWGANRDYGYNQQQNGPGLEEAQEPVRDMAVNLNTRGTSEKMNSFIPDGGRPLFTEDNFDRDPMDTAPSHKFVPMVGMPPINRHQPIAESMTPFEKVGPISHNTKYQNQQLPIFNYKNQMQDPTERYNTRYNSFDNPQDSNYNTYFVVDPNIPQGSQDLPFLQVEEQNQVVPNEEQFTETDPNKEKDPKPTNFIPNSDLPIETSQSFGSNQNPGGEMAPEISPSTYVGTFEPQYYDDTYMPNIYPQKTKSGSRRPELPPGLSTANRNRYLEDTYSPFDRSPYYSGDMGYYKPHFNYRDEYYY